MKMDGRTLKAHVYYRDNMWRIEHHEMGPVNVSIVRKDKAGCLAAALPHEAFQAVPYSADQDLLVTEALDGEISREQIGAEAREGHPTILYEVVTRQGKRTDAYYQWVATDIHFPMKLAKKTEAGSSNISM